MDDIKEKKKLSDIEGGIERYGNSFLIGGRWEKVMTACCGKYELLGNLGIRIRYRF